MRCETQSNAIEFSDKNVMEFEERGEQRAGTEISALRSLSSLGRAAQDGIAAPADFSPRLPTLTPQCK